MSQNYNGTNNGFGQDSNGTSLSAFLTSLVTNVVIWAVEVSLFIILRTLFKRIYEPRSFLEIIPEDKRVESLPPTPWGWIPKLLLTRTHIVIGKSGLDGYFLLRYLRMLITLFGASLLLVWPVLLPINAVNQRGAAGGVQGLDLLSISNVNSPKRYWAHVFVGIAFFSFTCYLMYHELDAFIRIRQDNLTSDLHKGTVRATTILVTSVPQQFLDVTTLRQVFSVFPGGVKNVFLNRDCSDLLTMVELRDSIAHRLEGAETELIRTANKIHRKEVAKKTKHAKKKQKKAPEGEQVEEAEEPIEMGENESLVDRYVPKKKRPTYRIPLAKWMPSLPLIGKKVDTVKWAREELKKMNPTIARLQARPERFDPMNSAFIQFNTQLAAHMACQSVTSHKPMFMTPRYIETAPQDVVWGNMQLVWWQRVVRVYLINTAIAALIIFYAIPTAFVGSISNITYLTNLLPWLRWIYNLPSQLLGLVTGLLPAVMLSLWLAILPFILRFACHYQGWPTRTVIELKVQDLYFAFMVIQVFLVVSIASSSTAVVTQIIQNPSDIPSLLAENLPKSSNFFFSYLLLQGLSVSAGTLLQIVTLILFYALGKLFDKTPRKLWHRFNTLPGLGWGTTYPIYTNLAVIGISYAIISPLIMLFVIITFCLFYFTYLYNFLFVNGFVTDTGGLAFPKAIYQTFTGLYFAEICLLGIFFITSGARAQGIVMVVVLVLTALYQLKLQDMFDPLITYLPIDIQEELFNQVQAQKVEDGRNPDEEQAQFEGPAPNDIPSEHEKPSVSSLQATPVPPARDKFVPESPQASNEPGPEPDEKLSELDEIPSGEEDRRVRWLNPAAQIRDQFHNISDKLPAISIPGLTKKKTLDDDDADVDTTLMRKFTHELSPEELTAIAFEHAAMRSRPPILWIPEDELGIAKDEIRRTKVECGKEVSITCRGAKLTEKGNIVFEGNPPDYFHIPSF